MKRPVRNTAILVAAIAGAFAVSHARADNISFFNAANQNVTVKDATGQRFPVNAVFTPSGTQNVDVVGSDTWAPVAPGAATATQSDLMGCQYNSTPPTFTDGQQGRVTCSVRGGIVVSGGVAPGSTAIYSPVSVSGNDSASGTGAVHTLHTDASGNLNVVGNQTDGGAITATAPVLMAGQDGTNVQTIFTDTSGRQRVVGSSLAGAAVDATAAPVKVGISDGTNIQVPLGDTSGRQIVIGAAASGAAVTGNPVLIGGSDGTNARTFATDSSGRLLVTGLNANPVPVGGTIASGATDSGNPVKIGCVNNTTLPTVTNGQRVDCQAGTRGAINVTLFARDANITPGIITPSSDAIGVNAGLDTVSQNVLFNGTNWDRSRSITGTDGTGLGVQAMEPAGALFANITAATTTTVKSGTGTLHKIIVNTPVASATITVYNNTAGSGTKIGTITLPATITGESPFTITYDLWFSTGLTLVTSGATDITVIYR